MSAKREHRKRLNLRLAYLRELEIWLALEPLAGVLSRGISGITAARP